jgi:hypothetical protein
MLKLEPFIRQTSVVRDKNFHHVDAYVGKKLSSPVMRPQSAGFGQQRFNDKKINKWRLRILREARKDNETQKIVVEDAEKCLNGINRCMVELKELHTLFVGEADQEKDLSQWKSKWEQRLSEKFVKVVKETSPLLKSSKPNLLKS